MSSEMTDTETKAISELIETARSCPFCGEYPSFDINITPRHGSFMHLANRDGCCNATFVGQSKIFYADQRKIVDLLSNAQRLINDWNRRDE